MQRFANKFGSATGGLLLARQKRRLLRLTNGLLKQEAEKLSVKLRAAAKAARAAEYAKKAEAEAAKAAEAAEAEAAEAATEEAAEAVAEETAAEAPAETAENAAETSF